MKSVRVIGNTVVEVFAARPNFHPALMATIFDVANDAVQQNWTYNGGAVAPPAAPVADDPNVVRAAEIPVEFIKALLTSDAAKQAALKAEYVALPAAVKT